MVRHPLKRLESCYRQALSTGHWYKKHYVDQIMPRDFNKAVLEYPHFLETTKYWERLSDYKRYFPDEQIKIIFLENFSHDTKVVLKDIYSFLGVTDFFSSEGVHQNKGRNKRMKSRSWAKLKRTRVVYKIGKMFPKSCTKILNQVLSSPVPRQVNWDQEIKQIVISKLKEDSQKLLKFAGKSNDFWEFKE